MSRRWQTVLVPSLLLVLFTARAPWARATDPTTDQLKRLTEHLESLDTTLKKTFAEVRQEIQSVRQELKGASAERADAQLKLQLALAKILSLDQRMAEVRRDLDALKKRPAAVVSPPVEKGTLEEIKARLTVIERQLAQRPSQGRMALYPAAASEGPPSREERARQDDRLKQMEDSLRKMNASLKKSLGKLHDRVDAFRRDARDLKEEQARAERRLQRALATTALQTQLAEIRAELAATKRAAPAQVAFYPPAATDSAALEEINRRLAQIVDRVSQVADVSQTAYYPAPAVSYRPARTSYYAAPAPVGRVVLVNQYPEDVTVMVNGRPYRVAAGASAALNNQPAGSLWYEVITTTWGPRGRRTTTLAANETLTVTIR